MKRTPLEKKNFDILSGYGIHSIEPNACECMRFKAGETILNEGAPITHLLIVVSGKAKVCSTAENGKDLLICYYISGGIMGDIELMTNTYVAATSIAAVTDFECISLPYKRNAADLKNNIEFMNRVGYELALKLLGSSKSRVNASLYSGEARLCSYILEAAHGDKFDDTLTDTACSIGISYRHLLRLVNKLCQDKVLEKKKKGFAVTDRKALISRSADGI